MFLKLEGYHKSAESKYDKERRTVKLSDEIGVKQAAAQLGIPYYSLAEWRYMAGGRPPGSAV